MKKNLSNDLGPVIRLGRVVLSPGVKQRVSGQRILTLLQLHVNGGRWADHWPPPPVAFTNGCFISFYGRIDQCVVIHTEADRKLTSVYLAEESGIFRKPRNPRRFWRGPARLASVLKRGIKTLTSFIGSRVFFYRRTNGN